MDNAELWAANEERKADREHVEKIPQVESGRKSREVVAELAGFGNETTYRQAAKVVESGVPELVADKARDYYDKRAEERQKASGGDRKSTKAKIGSGTDTTTDHTRARDEAGKALGVSGSLVGKQGYFAGIRGS